MKKLVLLILVIQLLIVACSRSSEKSETGPSTPQDVEADEAPPPRILPTLYPTATRFPTPVPTNTSQPITTAPIETPVTFDQLVVELRYAIPAIGLDRSLKGDVSGRLQVSDQLTDNTVERRNQAGVLIEMQQSLPDLTLEDLPDGCDHCVWLEYDLPLAGDQDAGWLQDVRMLASLENFTSALLGPHFPPETIAALRRSATLHQVAHTVAITADGRLWRWTATEGEIQGPILVEDGDPLLADVLDAIDLDDVGEIYAADCPDGAGLETLFVKNSEEAKQVEIICPELSLPTTLLPIYLILDGNAVDLFANQRLETQEPVLPKESLLHYRNSDGFRLTINTDGQTSVVDESGVTFSQTVTVSLAVSLTMELLDSEILRPGVESFLQGEEKNLILVRGPDGLFELGWDGEADPLIQPIILRLDDLIEMILSANEEPENGNGDGSIPTEPTPETTATPAAGNS